MAIGACGGHKANTSVAPAQRFSRQMSATPARVIAAAVTTFSDYGIPIASADQTGGTITSMPVDVRGNWAGATGTFADRAECGAAVSDPEASRMVLGVHVQSMSNGADVTIEARPAKEGWHPGTDGAACYLKSTFMTRVLDEIASRANSNP